MIAIKLRKDYEDKTLEEIIQERNKILEQIKEYENKFVFGDPKYDEIIYSKPSPQTIYSVNNDDLIMLTQLINERLTKRDDTM